MRLAGIMSESYVDGPGLRFVLFAQGCPHQCPHCHNPESWSREAGQVFSVKQIIRMLKQQKKAKRGITLSGGEPFWQAEDFAAVAAAAHRMGLDVVTYTGFTYEQLAESRDNAIKSLLTESDILVDGRYIHALRDISLPFRGSSNQRVIDLSETRKNNRISLWA